MHAALVAQQGPPPPNPIVVDRFQQVISQLFTQRIVRLGGPVDDDMANLLVAQLLYLDSASPKKDITMYVNSPGGSVTAGMAPVWALVLCPLGWTTKPSGDLGDLTA